MRTGHMDKESLRDAAGGQGRVPASQPPTCRGMAAQSPQGPPECDPGCRVVTNKMRVLGPAVQMGVIVTTVGSKCKLSCLERFGHNLSDPTATLP
jgi:hypothetical protein